jgi:hypothetical protein
MYKTPGAGKRRDGEKASAQNLSRQKDPPFAHQASLKAKKSK